MGLISAALASGSNVLSGAWKEYFYQDALPEDVLVVAGKHKSARSSNNKGEDNVISNGSKIVVADGQAMIIVDQGKIVEISVSPGEFIFDTSSAPSFFCKEGDEGLWSRVKRTFGQMAENFSYGGLTASTQKVYYVNTKLIMNRKFGTPQPLYFRVVDSRANFDYDAHLKINGNFSFQIVDPILFYTNITGNVASEYRLAQIEPQLKNEFTDSLQDAIASINEDGLRPSGLPGKKQQMVAAMNEILKPTWVETYGIEIRTITMNMPTMNKEDEEALNQLQKAVSLSNPMLAAGYMVNAQAQAMNTAAGNTGGAMTGFMGMGMAGGAGGMSANGLFQTAAQMGAAAPQQPVGGAAPAGGAQPAGGAAPAGGAQPAGGAAPAGEAPKMQAGGWTCRKCGAANTGKFCAECGDPKPADEGWTCKCGALNKGKFCAECGSPKPEGAPTYKCDKCGWEPEDPKNPPKFCPECGDIFDDNDKV